MQLRRSVLESSQFQKQAKHEQIVAEAYLNEVESEVTKYGEGRGADRLGATA